MLICKNFDQEMKRMQQRFRAQIVYEAAGDTTEWQVKVGAARSYNTAMLSCTMLATKIDKFTEHSTLCKGTVHYPSRTTASVEGGWTGVIVKDNTSAEGLRWVQRGPRRGGGGKRSWEWRTAAVGI